MLGYLKLLVALPFAILVVLLAVANRQPVLLSLDPVSKGQPEIAVAVPLYALIFASVALGMVIGGLASWVAAGKQRRTGRQASREARRLRDEADRLRAAVAASRNPALPRPDAVG